MTMTDESRVVIVTAAGTIVRIPLGRVGRVAEIADTVAFLLSDAAGYITGQNIRFDGGITRSV